VVSRAVALPRQRNDLKKEGLAWGPDLPEGRHVLYVISDNDLDPALATQIYAFAIDSKAANLDYRQQFLPLAIFPPSQIKKILEHSKHRAPDRAWDGSHRLQPWAASGGLLNQPRVVRDSGPNDAPAPAGEP
jgi:hypothetical protein